MDTLLKFNPNHDEKGRFSDTAGGPITAYHSTRSHFDKFKTPARGASYFSPTPEGSRKGATAAANEHEGQVPNDPRPSHTYEVEIPSQGIQGLSLTPKEQAWFSKLPAKIVGDDAYTKLVVEPARKMGFQYTDNLYAEHKVGEGSYEYVKQSETPSISYARAASTGRDIYGREHPHFNDSMDERTAAQRVLAAGMKGYLLHDEGGLSVAMADPSEVRIKRDMAKLLKYSEDQPRDDHGRWSDEGGVPAAPGKSAIPPGRVRRFHYTEAKNADAIAREGLKIEHSTGRKVGDPVAVWSTPDSPYERKLSDGTSIHEVPRHMALVEFHDDPNNYRSNPYASGRSVPPENIVAIHQRWHERYRYAVENGLSAADARAASSSPGDSYARAADALERRQGVLKKFNPNHDEQGRFAESDTSGHPQTKTAAFKKWFGNSKVVNPDGSPMVMYHGTKAGDFSAFDVSKSADFGIHFGTAGQAEERLLMTNAKEGARVLPVYLRIENPFEWYDQGNDWGNRDALDNLHEKFPDDTAAIYDIKTGADLRNYLQSKGYDGVVYRNVNEIAGGDKYRREWAAHVKEAQAISDRVDVEFTPRLEEARAQVLAWAHKDEAKWDEAYRNFKAVEQSRKEALTAAGYDQAAARWSDAAKRMHAHIDDKANQENSYIVFSPTQIKSAVGNTGAFDPHNPDITKADDLLKFNPNHVPAGSAEGGQFTSGDGSSARIDIKGNVHGEARGGGKYVVVPGQGMALYEPKPNSAELDRRAVERAKAFRQFGGIKGFQKELAESWIGGKYLSADTPSWHELQNIARQQLAGTPVSSRNGAMVKLASQLISESKPLDYPLYRGITNTTADYKVGDRFSESLSSWTPHQRYAAQFASGDVQTYAQGPGTGGPEDRHVVITVRGTGMKALPVGRWLSQEAKRDLPPMFSRTDEHLASGEYEVTRVTKTEHLSVVEVQRVGDAKFNDLARADGATSLLKYNEHHAPAGSPEGGQFTSADGGGDKSDVHAQMKQIQDRMTRIAATSALKDIPAHIPKEQQESIKALHDYMVMSTAMLPEHKNLESKAQRVLKYGQPYYFDAKSFEGKRMTMKQCYKNCTDTVLGNSKLTYVEGYVTVHGVPIDHAWLTDGGGHVIDPTLRSGKDIGAYYGVPIKTSYLRETALKTKVYGVMSYTNQDFYHTDRTPPEKFVAKALLPTTLLKYNPNHAPAGSPEGGQFTSGEGGGGQGSLFPSYAPNPAARGLMTPALKEKFDTNDALYEKFQDFTNTTPEEFTRELGKGVNASIRMDAARINTDDGGRSIQIAWGIYDPNSPSKWGLIERTFDSGDVYHNLFELNEEHQGTGLAKQIMANFDRLYEKADIERIGLHASAEVGGYAWAKFGFAPDAREWSNLQKTTFATYLGKHKDTPAALRSIMTTSENPQDIWKIADSPQGKEILLRSNWHGSLYRSDPPAMDRWRRYVSSTNKAAAGGRLFSMDLSKSKMLSEAELAMQLIDDYEKQFDAPGLIKADIAPHGYYFDPDVGRTYKKLPIGFDWQKNRALVRKSAAGVMRWLDATRANLVKQLRSGLRKSTPEEEAEFERIAQEIALALEMGDAQLVINAIGEATSAAATEGVSQVLGRMGLPSTDQLFNTVDADMVAWADARAAELVGMRYAADGSLIPSANAEMRIDASTRSMVQQLIADRLDEGKTLAEIADELEEVTADLPYPFSEQRANLIASTEIANAASMGSLVAARRARDEANVSVKKAWLVADEPCPICEENGDAGYIELDEEFPSGDDAPTAHPNCRCAVIYDAKPNEDVEAGDGEEDTGDEEDLTAKYLDVLGDELLGELISRDSLIKYNPNHVPAGSPEGGEFTSASGSSGSDARASHVAARQKDGKWVGHDGRALPEHLQGLRIPPKWTDVTYSLDPKNKLQVTGVDSKGRQQAIYSKEFSSAQAAAKFARIDELNRKYDSIWKQNEAARAVPETKNVADYTRLIMETGIRPGSRSDTGADKQAYGATTLKGSHVYVNGDHVRLVFTGKKGVRLSIPITDPTTKRMLLDRKEAAGGRGNLFGVTDKELLDHVHSFDGGSFKTKDFRTLLGTRTAMAEVSRMRAPRDEKSYKKSVMAVAKKVSTKLGNTPTVALQSYINPTVFAKWRTGAGV